jgi:uroporphyrinogen-III synthase
MKSKVVAILETRTGAHIAELVARRGGVPMLAPALEEIPDIDARAMLVLMEQWRLRPFKIGIFQTGVGARALFSAADAAGATAELTQLLARAIVAVRGPKPVGELNARGVRIDIRAASPFTTETVLAALSRVDVNHAAVLVQRYGAPNEPLTRALAARGAEVQEIATYRWGLPTDTQPLIEFLAALSLGRVDAVLFTSAVQMHNLYTVAGTIGAAGQLAERLSRCVVGSIGPVCTRTLCEYGVTPAFEADPPKLGPLLNALDEALAPT